MASKEELLARLLQELRGSKSDDVRMRAAKDLRLHVSTVSRELSGENFTKFINDVNRRIFELVNSNDYHEKIGGIMAIDELIDIDGEDNTTKITRFANYLRIVLPGIDPQVSVLASKALGRLAMAGGTLTPDFVEFEIKRSLEWLQGDRNESRRLASVLVLKELALNAPILFYPYVSQFFDNIWGALRDTKVGIREGASEAVRACLHVIYQRDKLLRQQCYQRLYEEAQKGFKQGTAESIHGSLLMTKELLQYPGDMIGFLQTRYNSIFEVVFKNKDHRDSLVRRSVISLMPLLATFNAESFASLHLSNCMVYLLGQLKKDKERSAAFLAIGEVSIAVKANVNQYLDAILQNIKDSLMPKSRKSGVVTEAAVFQCISMLARAVGQALTKHMHQLLEQMFSTGLSEPLTVALVDLAKHIPPLLPSIQEKLLDMLAVTLSGQPYKYPGSPPSEQHSTMTSIQGTQVGDSKDIETITLALRTLGNFDFSGHILHEFVRESVVMYLEDDHVEVRNAAAQTCCALLARDTSMTGRGSSSRTTQIVGEVLEKLLTVGITDPEPSIRQTVLASLDKRFDFYLAQAENVRSLFIALNDEVFTIRELSIGIIGRLTEHNPAYVMPSLRKTLIQLLTELEYSNVSRNKEESAQLLGHLMGAAKRLIKPYAAPILKVVLAKLKDPSPGVSARVLTALGELAQVAGEDMTKYLDQLLPLIIEMLQDQSSAAKREAALGTLGKLVTATGFVIEPYLRYPQLLALLITFLKTEQQLSIRREAMKVLGILGALDPYRQRMGAIESSPAKGAFTETQASPDATTEQMLMNMSPSHEDYYPTVVINALMKILKDPSLATHHTSVIQAVMLIFKTLGLKCVPFLPQIMRPYLNMMQTCPTGMVEFHFNNLAQLVSIVRQHIRNYLDEIFALIKEYWNISPNIQITSVSLITAIAVALDGEFKIYLPSLLPLMLTVFEADIDKDNRQPTKEVLSAFKRFGSTLEEYLHLVIPVIVRHLERADVPVQLRKTAIQTVGQLCRKINFSDYASRIVHPLTRIISSPQTPPDLRPVAMDTLAALVYQLGSDYITFIPMVNKVLIKNRIIHPRYDMLVQKLLKNEPMPQELTFDADDSLNEAGPDDSAPAEATSVKKLPVNQPKLKKAWEASQRSTKDDWLEWIRRFSVELLKESPSHALRACASLAAVYFPLARELFNAAFVSCWTELYDQFQDELVKSLETALMSPQVPPEILQTLLNLAEFMEHDDKPLPIPIRTLGSYSTKCHAYAKALHYKEVEFHSSPSTPVIEALISINNQLQQPDAAIGILKFSQQHHNIELKESWYEKLQRWEDALVAYEGKQREDPLNFDVTLGRMRCLQALGDFERLSQLTQEKWNNASDDVRKQIAPLGAAAAWGLWQWELMDDYIAAMHENSPDGAFFRAILALHRNQFGSSQQYIDKTRDLLDAELTALLNESYNRSFNVVVRVQMLAELEEIIQYKQLHDNSEAQAFIRSTWNKRLKGTQRNVDVWQRILKIHSLVVSSQEDMDMWIKFANLCRKSGRFNLCQKTLISLFGTDPEQPKNSTIIFQYPQVTYSYLKYFWSSGNKQEAFKRLGAFTAKISEQEESRATHAQLLARCHLKLGQWFTALDEQLTPERIPQMLDYFSAATKYDRNWYKAWHSWALANFEVISHYEMKGENTSKSLLTNHVVPAINGFFRSVALSSGNSLQDTLRLLTLWFKYGYQQDVHAAIGDGLASVSIDTWLQVIPQLIARIHAPSANVRRLIHQLLSDVGKQHPQALIYPLTVASKSQSAARKSAANLILDKMRQHSAALVDQAILVSQELIRVAILWHEMWHEGLEEASRQYFGDHNIEAMLTTLEPLHAMMERGPETLREISFNQAFGHDLQEAHEWCKKYKKSLNINDLNQAWDLYYLVFRRINKQLPQLTTLEFQYVSPRLLIARDLDLAVPGTYRSGDPIVSISSFVPTLNVITSKQRPRKLTIMGSDGSEYQYLLKGHEDLRQDERVMQLFGLVNTLLAADMETFKRHLSIHRYPVIPLSPNSGLIGWVPHCDTLHALIRDYRDSRKILLNIEHRLMQQMAPDYENLTLMQKVEVFQYALDNTTGQDLYKVLWLKSKNSEAWLDRRTNYTRSLAVMSMVGYILGLGDRHPSNLMLDRFTGKVIHIDFGDCFEVAMQREKFPERFPFRLTRMLINAMEVSGIEGNFRTTCESVMRVLRDNKESLMAVLEAFVYDPLINWRLLTNKDNPAQDTTKAKDKASEMFEDNTKVTAESALKVGRSRMLQRNENDLVGPEEDNVNRPEVLNARAVAVINRVSNKLTGRDFKQHEVLDVPSQVQRLILQATAVENLCQCYVGWCPFW